MKRLLTILLALTIIITAMPLAIADEKERTSGEVEYTLKGNGTATIVGYHGDSILMEGTEKVYNGRTPEAMELTPMAKYTNTGEFSILTDMPYDTWWYGQFSKIKAAFEQDFANCPVAFADTQYMRVEKLQTVAAPGALYHFVTSGVRLDCMRTYGGANDWFRHARDKEIINNSGVSITATNKDQFFSDCNDAPLNTVYRIHADAKMENTPFGYGMSTAAGVYDGTLRSVTGYISGTLMTYGASDSAKHQTFITNAGAGSEPAIMYFRTYYYSTGWTEWHGVSDILSPTSTNIAIRKKMIAPYLDADGNPTATNTGTPNPQCMIDDPRIFNDFNDAPNNSIYQIDLDCDASVMANNPNPGKSSVLLTSSFTYRTRHAIYQMCIGLDGSRGSDAFMFYRYCYQIASNPAEYMWTPWERVITEKMLSGYVQNKGRISDGSDMNTIKGNSVYLVGDNAGHQNVPTQKAGFLTTKTVNTITLQTYETLDGERYSRNAVGDVWSEWVSN